jgi:hypothetical protein
MCHVIYASCVIRPDPVLQRMCVNHLRILCRLIRILTSVCVYLYRMIVPAVCNNERRLTSSPTASRPPPLCSHTTMLYYAPVCVCHAFDAFVLVTLIHYVVRISVFMFIDSCATHIFYKRHTGYYVMVMKSSRLLWRSGMRYTAIRFL